MKKLFLTAVLFSVLLSCGWGIDFGGNIENYSFMSNEGNSWDSDSWDQTDKLSLWISLISTEMMQLKGQGSIAYSKDEYDFLADVDYLYFSQIVPFDGWAFSYKVGRFFQSEFSGKVFSHKFDGALCSFSMPKCNISLGGGYTGLLTKPVSSINNTPADMVDDDDDDIYFAPKKIVALAGINFPSFMSQELNLSAVAQIDLRSDDLLEDGDKVSAEGNGGKLNTCYFGGGLSGFLSSSFMYNAFGYVQAGKTLTKGETEYKDEDIFAFLGGGSLTYFNSKFLYSKVTASFLYASGDDDHVTVQENTDGKSSQFVPISESKLGLVFSPSASNIITAGLEYSLKPFSGGKAEVMKNMQVSLSGTSFFKASEGAVSESKACNTSEDKYIGTEGALKINFRPYSDFGITAAGGVFFPNTNSDGPMAENNRDPEIGGMLIASFSF